MVEDLMARVKERLGPKALKWFERNPKRYYIDLKPEDIPEACKFMFREMGARFSTASGVDTPRGLEILYHFAFDSLGKVVSLRTTLPKDNPEIESVGKDIPAIEWIEREMWEMLGIKFRHHPDMKHLLLADDWPEGEYPLRRERDYGEKQ